MKKYENFSSALDVLVQAPEQDLDNTFIQSGIIDKFFIQFELGWKLLKALLSYEGDSTAATGSPREIIKVAYQYFEFMDEELWLGMLRDRNNAAHIYDEASAKRLVDDIVGSFIPEFVSMREGLVERYGEMLIEPDHERSPEEPESK